MSKVAHKEDVMARFIGDTSKFNDVQVVYDDGEFVIAKGVWDGKHDGVGVRWAGDGIGYPQTFGKPQWMILPDNIGAMILVVLNTLSIVKNIVPTVP